MATTQSESLWGVPYGVWIVLTYQEAHAFSGPDAEHAVDAITTAIGTPWATLAGIAIKLQMKYIYDLNEKSGGQGVRLLFVPALGMIVSVERRTGVSPAPRMGLLAFKASAGRIGFDTLWLSERGQWDFARALPVAVDISGRKNQICVLYGYPNENTGLFVFPDDSLCPRKLWESGQGQWEWSRSRVVAADVRRINKNELCILYGYPGNQTALFVFDEASARPVKVWDSGAGQWDWSHSQLVSADVDGNGINEVCILYGYPQSNTALFVFDSMMRPRKVWESGINQWSWDASRVASAAAFGGGKNDLCVLYGYPGNDTALFAFDRSRPTKVWESGPNRWNWAQTQIAGAALHGTPIRELCAMYDYGGSTSALFNYDPVLKLRECWNSGPGQWQATRSRLFSGAIPGNASALCALYDYT